MFNNLMITCVEKEYTSEYIANVFWNQQLARVKNVTLIAYIRTSDNELYYVAYIDIDQWCDTEAAYNFVNRLKEGKEPRIVHHDEEWWPVALNTHNNGGILPPFTASFNSSYFL
jgi:hypothetical protein